eukprot:CAMPEP_0183436252 /NCGR_PEP_ID=MMETSP0370-20130417/69147_1 /TAXON_ID=268820 /ORGANISM="Peridinium aciculiferum, Strain PAER-2" /LENGTH=46 /DNA_ID= /DNA_START= /DNA_END= /DNA_ORIENTATION=
MPPGNGAKLPPEMLTIESIWPYFADSLPVVYFSRNAREDILKDTAV